MFCTFRGDRLTDEAQEESEEGLGRGRTEKDQRMVTNSDSGET